MRRTAVPALLAALLLVGAACSDSGEPQAEPSRATSDATPTSSPDPTEPTEPTEPPESTVAPATGPELRMPLSSVRAPEGWKVDDQMVRTLMSASSRLRSVGLGEINAFGSQATLDEQVKIRNKATIYQLIPKRMPDVELDGVPFYHLSGKIQPLNWTEEYGTIVEDRIVTLIFQFSPPGTPAGRDRIVDQVLATFQWND